jgi:putative peptide zinc metalloprotease protein
MALPGLRQELSLHAGAPAPDGSPTWTLQDPVSHRFYQLSWPAFEILSRWHLGEAEALIDAVNNNTTLTINLDDVKGVVEFLSQHHLLRVHSPEDTARLEKYRIATTPGKAKWLLKNYLFFRLPLVRPEHLLNILAPAFALVFTRKFWWIVAGILATGIYLVSRQWDAFIHTFSGYSGWQAFIGIGLALSFAKILHELGHALTAHYYGCRVPTMGIAFLVLFPVLYTDTNDSWKLPSQRARLHIAAAGMLAELVLACCATLLWSFLPEGHLKTGVFLLATSTWIITLLINASPFMRFDGYFLLADYLNMPNLHDRAFALGKWWLREKLFGFNDPVPEHFPPKRHRFLVALAFGTAIYRAFLFLTIAFLVYHLFFKVLGIILMLVELAWFLGVPVQREIKIWWQRRTDMHWNNEAKRSCVLLALLLAVLLLPWQSSLRVPAVVMAEQAQGIYLPYAAKIVEIKVSTGDKVKAGDTLASFSSPDLDYQLQKAKAHEQRLRWQWEQQSFAADLQLAGPALRKHWEGARQQVESIQQQINQLTLPAPFDGVVVSLNDAHLPGSWLTAGEQVFYIAAPDNIKGEAFVNEAQLLRLQTQDKETLSIRFVAQQIGASRLNCSLQSLDTVNITQLDQAYLASIYGGNIATQQNAQHQLVPLESQFRVRFHACEGIESLNQELAGTVKLSGERKSFVVRAGTWMMAVIVSEAGF